MKRVLAAAAGLSVLVALVAAPPASAAVTPVVSQTWGTDGRVSTLLTTSRGVVVGGSFSHGVAPSGATTSLGNIGLWDPASGQFRTWPVRVSGQVLALAVSGDTVYLGGSFSAVNGTSRRDLAAVSLTTGSLLSWAPTVSGGHVAGLAASSSAVFAGGSFTSARDASGSTTASRVAKFSSAGGVDRTWTQSITLDARVRALELSSGGALYIGGDFTTVNGNSRYGRTVKVGTGSSATVDTAFRSGANNGNSRSPVYDLVLSGTDLLIAAGGGGGGCARQNAATGATAWTVHTNGNVQAVGAIGSFVYCGGHFGGSGAAAGQTRYKLIEVQRTNGALTSFAPRVNSALGVWALEAAGTSLVAGGDFTKVSGRSQPHLGRFGATS